MRTSSCTGKHSEPTRSPDGNGVNREVHAPFCERPEVKSLWPTHPPVRVLDTGRGRTKICQFCAHATDDRSQKGPAPPAVAYIFAGGRGKKEIAGQLAGFEGVLQVDGYAAYMDLPYRGIAIRSWIAGQGGLPRGGLLTLTGRSAGALYPRCTRS
jgi:hypothetical protein